MHTAYHYVSMDICLPACSWGTALRARVLAPAGNIDVVAVAERARCAVDAVFLKRPDVIKSPKPGVYENE